MALATNTLDFLAIAGSASGVLGLGVGLGATLRLSRLRRAYSALAGNAQTGDVIEAMARHLGEVEGLRGDVASLRAEARRLSDDLADSIRHIAVVRYDAFNDMGGRLSFSAALLDDAGDGLVLTSINGRTETRTYAKGVKAGGSDHPLSPEETQVIEHAVRAAARSAR